MVDVEVLSHAEVPEHACRLRDVREAATCARPERFTRDVRSFEHDRAARDRRLADERAEERRLARARGTEHADDLAGLRFDVDAAKNGLRSTLDA